MTQQEFFDRTGLSATPEEFSFVHKVYMACATLDKDAFCREYKKHGASRIITELMDALDAKARAYDTVFNDGLEYRDKITRDNLDMAQFLLGKAAVYNDPDLEERAIALTSKSVVVLIKIKNGCPLSNEDFKYIADNLK